MCFKVETISRTAVPRIHSIPDMKPLVILHEHPLVA